MTPNEVIFWAAAIGFLIGFLVCWIAYVHPRRKEIGVPRDLYGEIVWPRVSPHPNGLKRGQTVLYDGCEVVIKELYNGDQILVTTLQGNDIYTRSGFVKPTSANAMPRSTAPPMPVKPVNRHPCEGSLAYMRRATNALIDAEMALKKSSCHRCYKGPLNN